MAGEGRDWTNICIINEEVSPGHKTVIQKRLLKQMDVDKALERTAINPVAKVLQTAQISILNEVVFFNDLKVVRCEV